MKKVFVGELDGNNLYVSHFSIEVSDIRTYEEVLESEGHTFRSVNNLDDYFPPMAHPFVVALSSTNGIGFIDRVVSTEDAPFLLKDDLTAHKFVVSTSQTTVSDASYLLCVGM